MGLFDEYIPDPPLSCPACGLRLDSWQGKGGPNLLMVWRQGVIGPKDQAIVDEDFRFGPEEMAELRLPDEFQIYTQCCGDHFFINAYCKTTDEIWSHTDMVTAETAKQQKQERRGEFKRRVRWLNGGRTKEGGQSH